MEKIFEGKVAIVTGARTGMGLATAQRFARMGTSVALVGRHEPAAEAQALRDEGLKAISLECDVSRYEDCERMVTETVREFGRLDFAFNNAGIMKEASDITETSIESYEETMRINCTGIWACMKYELEAMQKLGEGGAIVNCSSYGGKFGVAGRSPYTAAKHAVCGMTKTVALEYADKNIRVNAICPGTFLTPMVQKMFDEEYEAMMGYVNLIPAKRVGKPEEIAALVTFLCSPEAGFIIGECITIDGGVTASV